jgi:hypothetical protein
MSEKRCLNCGSSDVLPNSGNSPICQNCYNDAHGIPKGTLTVKIDRTLTEQRLMDEKDALAKELAELRQKESERLESEKIAQEEKEQQRANRKPATGSVPFNPPSGDMRKGYQNYSSMVNDLRAREQSHDETAKEQMDGLFNNLLNEALENRAPIAISGKFNPENLSLAEIYNRNHRAKIRLNNGVA